jgi:hypothetical protein
LITFRYHIVTLVAVFLALGVGVLFGASFIDQNTVEGLRKTQAALGHRNENLRNRIVALEKGNESLNRFVASTAATIQRDALKDRSVTLISFDSTPQDATSAVIATLGVAGSSLDGSIKLSDQLDLRSPDVRRKIGLLLGSASIDQKALSELLVSQLSTALMGRNPGFLQKLIDAGMASSQPGGGEAIPTGVSTVPSAVTVVAGNGNELNQRLAIPLVGALAAGPLVTSAVEKGASNLRLVGPVRRESGVKVVTVDSIETPVGQAAYAAGLKAGFAGQFGAYGFADGATSVLPQS